MIVLIDSNQEIEFMNAKNNYFFTLLCKFKKYNIFFCQNFIYDAGCSSCTKYCVLRKFCGILLFAQIILRKIAQNLLRMMRNIVQNLFRSMRKWCAKCRKNKNLRYIAQILRKKYHPSAKTLQSVCTILSGCWHTMPFESVKNATYLYNK